MFPKLRLPLARLEGCSVGVARGLLVAQVGEARAAQQEVTGGLDDFFEVIRIPYETGSIILITNQNLEAVRRTD